MATFINPCSGWEQINALKALHPSGNQATMIVLRDDHVCLTDTKIPDFVRSHPSHLVALEDLWRSCCHALDQVEHEETDQVESQVQQLQASMMQQLENMTWVLTGQNKDISSQSIAVSNLAAAISSRLDRLDAGSIAKQVADSVVCRLPSEINTNGVQGLLRDAVAAAVAPVADSSSQCKSLIGQLSQRFNAMREQQVAESTKQACHSQAKGRLAEDKVYELLSEQLGQDDIELERVAGKAHSCDFNARCLSCTDVRIEIKAYNQLVDKKEVQKYVNDLLGCNCHGILVSLHTGIVGKAQGIDIERLPNGMWAAYISKNEYDMSTIRMVIRLLHGIGKGEGQEGTDFAISAETM